jgi:hypothetical protein
MLSPTASNGKDIFAVDIFAIEGSLIGELTHVLRKIELA